MSHYCVSSRRRVKQTKNKTKPGELIIKPECLVCDINFDCNKDDGGKTPEYYTTSWLFFFQNF